MSKQTRQAWTDAVKRLQTPQKPRSKYGAVKTTVDGITFDSKREAARYHELKLLEKAKAIHNLTLQPEYPLMVGRETIGKYVADFGYCVCLECVCHCNATVVEDSKGFKTPLYRWKKRHVEAQYGIQIREV